MHSTVTACLAWYQASFSTASHESLDSLDDDVDFKVDNKLRRQIEQANLQEAQERVETQLEGKQVSPSVPTVWHHLELTVPAAIVSSDSRMHC